MLDEHLSPQVPVGAMTKVQSTSWSCSGMQGASLTQSTKSRTFRFFRAASARDKAAHPAMCSTLAVENLLAGAGQAQEVRGEEMASMQLGSPSATSSLRFAAVQMCCAMAQDEGSHRPSQRKFPTDGRCSMDMCRNPTRSFKNPNQGCSRDSRGLLEAGKPG